MQEGGAIHGVLAYAVLNKTHFPWKREKGGRSETMQGLPKEDMFSLIFNSSGTFINLEAGKDAKNKMAFETNWISLIV